MSVFTSHLSFFVCEEPVMSFAYFLFWILVYFVLLIVQAILSLKKSALSHITKNIFSSLYILCPANFLCFVYCFLNLIELNLESS